MVGLEKLKTIVLLTVCVSRCLDVMQAIKQFRVELMDTTVQACSHLKAEVIKDQWLQYVLGALAFVVT